MPEKPKPPAPMPLLLLLLLGLAAPSPAFAQVSEEDDFEIMSVPAQALEQEQVPDLRQAAKLIVEQTNNFREQQGRERLETNAKLTETAQDFADFMARTDQYGHTADGNRPSQRVKQHGYEYCLVAENIAYQFSSIGFATGELAEKFVEGWKNSPGHRKNMLNPAATETGVAISQSDQTGYFYAVQLFGRPKSMQITFKVTNKADAAVQYKIGEHAFPLPPRFTRTHRRCRPSELTFVWPEESERQPKTFEAADGAQFVITGEGQKMTVEKNGK